MIAHVNTSMQNYAGMEIIDCPRQVRDDIKSCEKISILNSFEIAWPPPSHSYLKPEFPTLVLEKW